MKIYPTADIRNVGIVGHGGTGKTQLVSSLLFTAGATPRFGKVAEGTTTTDWTKKKSRERSPFKLELRMRNGLARSAAEAM